MDITKYMQRGHHDSSKMNFLVRWARNLVYGFDETKYWRRREIVTNPENPSNKFWKLYCLYYCKKIEINMTASMGTIYNGGTKFNTPPICPMVCME